MRPRPKIRGFLLVLVISMCSSGSGPQKSTHNNKVGLLVCEKGEKREKRERRTKIEDHWDTAHNIKNPRTPRKHQDSWHTPFGLRLRLWRLNFRSTNRRAYHQHSLSNSVSSQALGPLSVSRQVTNSLESLTKTSPRHWQSRHRHFNDIRSTFKSLASRTSL